MNYRRLGRTGLKVSELCLGTMTFGFSTPEAEGVKLVDYALDHGINFFDTANSYTGGASETILGNAFNQNGKRHQAVLATKFFNPMGDGINDSGMSRVHIMRAIEESLRRLQTDYIDVYYIHHVDVETPLEEMLWALNDLVVQGKVRYIACSNYQCWRLAVAMGISEAKGWHRFECYQPQYSLVVRHIEAEIMPYCRYKNVGIVPWGPLAGGFLTGKYRPGERLVEGTRSAEGWVFQQDDFAPNADEILAELLTVSDELGRKPSQVALRWVLAQPGISSVIAGARVLSHLSDNLGAIGWDLPEEALRRLNTVSAPPIVYPESMESHMVGKRARAVKKF